MLTVATNSATQKGEKKGQALVYIEIPMLISYPRECRFQPSMED
jgi:hypothetical protein